MHAMLKVSHTEPFSCHSHYHHWCWWSSIHQHQRLCMPPHPHLCSSLYKTSRRTVLWVHKLRMNSSEKPLLHQLSLPVPSVGFLNYQCKPCYILESTQLWSKLNYQCKPCSILNSTQQHSFCILIRSDLSSMHSVSLDSTQLNIPVSCN